MGRILLIGGLLIAAVGGLLMLGFPIGRLPGDLGYRRGNVTIYLPITSSILLSMVLTFVLTFLRR